MVPFLVVVVIVVVGETLVDACVIRFVELGKTVVSGGPTVARGSLKT